MNQVLYRRRNLPQVRSHPYKANIFLRGLVKNMQWITEKKFSNPSIISLKGITGLCPSHSKHWKFINNYFPEKNVIKKWKSLLEIHVTNMELE